MSDLDQAARLALDVLEDLVSTLDDDRAFMTSALSAITALRAALAQQAEPVAIPGAIPMSKVVARSRAMPERADALERARERLEQAEPVDKALTKTEPPVDKEQAEPVVDGSASDGYHTFNELYDFRMSYNAALFNEWAAQGKHFVHKSYRHHTGELCFGGGYFVVVAVLPGGQISNHYKNEYWDLFDIPQAGQALFEFDSHTGADVLSRLKSYRPQQAKPVQVQAEPVAMEHLKQYGYAPGDYMRTCIHCKVISIMDKRSSICLGCARQLHAAALEQTEPVVEPDDASGNPSY